MHAAKNKIPKKLLWSLIILFGSFVGAIIYYFIIFRKVAPKHRKGQFGNRLAINIAIGIIVIIGSLSVKSSLQPVPATDYIPFDQAITHANAGEIKQIDIIGDELRLTRNGEDKPSMRTRKERGSSIYDQGLTNRSIKLVIHNQ